MGKMMQKQVNQLKELMINIELEYKNTDQRVWFYPEYRGIKGFLGVFLHIFSCQYPL